MYLSLYIIIIYNISSISLHTYTSKDLNRLGEFLLIKCALIYILCTLIYMILCII